MRAYGTFLSPTSAQLLPSGRSGRAWTRTLSTQSSSDSDDEEMTETRAVLWEVIHLHRDSLPDTARADVNFLGAMVAVLGLVVVGVYGGVAMGGVTGAFVEMIRGALGN